MHLCENKLTATTFVVKILEKRLARDEFVMAYKKEMHLLASLNHPYIIKIYEYFEDEERIYQILEYCKGGDLLTDINNKRKNFQTYSDKQVAVIMTQLISAVHYLHQNLVIHRDIKPDNILFVTGPPGIGCGKLKLTDFGVATKVTKKNEELHDMYGTSYYIAPEVILRNYTLKADVWSIGIIMFLMLKGTM